MGLASSQARLLSLTARMHQIEYKAARLEAMKLQMANESKQVYETYLEALDMTKVERKILNTDGAVSYIPFTVNDLYTYGNIDKQYMLQAMNGKMLIPESLHNSYMNEANLGGFLSSEGLSVDYTNGTNSDFDFVDEEYPEKHAQWETEEPNINDYFNPSSTQTLGDAFVQAGSGCYNTAKGGGIGCYSHVLAHIIDYTAASGFGDDGCNEVFYGSAANSYTTSTGQTFSIAQSDITGAGMDDNGGINDIIMSKISEIINGGISTPIFNTAITKPDGTVIPADPNPSSVDFTNDYEKLATIYADSAGHTKSIKQWAQDLYYICENYQTMTDASGNPISNTTVAGTIVTFQQHLTGTLGAFDLDQYNADYADWRNNEPQIHDIEIVTSTDRDQAQWYTNIWNQIGQNSAKQFTKERHNYTSNSGTPGIDYGVPDIPKNALTVGTSFFNTPETENYIVVPDDKLNDPEWLSNIITDGFAILQTVNKDNTEIYDTSVSVDVDLREVPDEIAIKKAEAKYEADMKKIDLKDRKYDVDLAAIETERNAIKQEMETLKTVAKDNVERTFKLFS